MIRCIPKDAFCTDEIYRVYSACMFEPTFEKFAEKAAEMRKDSSVSAFGAFQGEKLAGVCVVKETENDVLILGIAVDAESRSSGIGRSLIGCLGTKYQKTIIAETDCDAVGFYLKCGFSVRKMTCRKNGQSYRRFSCTLAR